MAALYFLFQTKEMFETESESIKLLRSLELFRVPETYTVSVSALVLCSFRVSPQLLQIIHIEYGSLRRHG